MSPCSAMSSSRASVPASAAAQARHRPRSCWSCRAAAGPEAAAWRRRRPRNSAPSRPWTSPSPLFSTIRPHCRGPPARPAVPGDPGLARKSMCSTSRRPARQASMSAMPLRLRSLSGLLIMAIAARSRRRAPSRGQDALDQIEVGRLVDVDRGLGDRASRPRPRRSAQPTRRPAPSPASRRAQPQQVGQRGGSARRRAPGARAFAVALDRRQNAIALAPPAGCAAGTGWHPNSRRRESADRSAACPDSWP